jgi:ATP-dependent phosphofructokinase / diphosphate-dependent phosphofructokinase
MSTIKNVFYAQSGGVTAVINASACGVIETARHFPAHIGKIYAGVNGITGALKEEMIDTSQEDPQIIAALRHTPGGAFGSCRYKLKKFEEDGSDYLRLLEVFKSHQIGYFFYNGGGDSQDTILKISQITRQMGYPLTCIGIPKTIDNDLAHTDSCPGFGSAAKYVATSIREAGLDIASMCSTSTKVFVMEVMGRHAGWIAAAAGLAAEDEAHAPHIILFPEVPFQQENFLNRVRDCVKTYGFCAIIASEGLRNENGEFLTHSSVCDAFGNTQLGGIAPTLAGLIKHNLGYKYHWAVVDYLQRSARHIASSTDVQQAYALGKAAVERAASGETDIMLTIRRLADEPYQWDIGSVPLTSVANVEKKMPKNFISADGFGITDACRRYLLPLIQGEDHPPYIDGLPYYVRLKNIAVQKKLTPINSGMKVE